MADQRTGRSLFRGGYAFGTKGADTTPCPVQPLVMITIPALVVFLIGTYLLVGLRVCDEILDDTHQTVLEYLRFHGDVETARFQSEHPTAFYRIVGCFVVCAWPYIVDGPSLGI